MSALDTQVGGDHYRVGKIQPWDVIEDWGLNYFEGNVVKYLMRWRRKNGLEDLEKAAHYLTKVIEMAKRDARARTQSD
jgi:hypothetical protein